MQLPAELSSWKQRPWLAVIPELASDLVFKERGGRVTIEFRIRNTGNSPALNIMINIHFIVEKARADSLLETIMNSQTEYYSNLRRPDPMVIGDNLFPQDKLEKPRSMAINRDEIEKVTAGRQDGGFSPILVGSVSYRSPIDNDIHHTGFIYDLLKPKPDEPRLSLLFGSHDHTVPMEEMRLIRAFSSGFVD